MLDRDRLLAAALFAVAVAWSLALALAGTTEGVLYMAPLALVALPLVLGRYPGERALDALGGRRRPRPRPCSDPRPVAGLGARVRIRGGELIAVFEAERPPPAVLLA
jgi:hypothetical protein